LVPGFPECEITDALFLVLIAPNASGGSEFFQIQMSEMTIVGEPIDAKINRTILRLISTIAFKEFSDHLDHLADVDWLGRSGIRSRRFDAQG
jgi:hypothetical protein